MKLLTRAQQDNFCAWETTTLIVIDRIQWTNLNSQTSSKYRKDSPIVQLYATGSWTGRKVLKL